MTGPRLAVIVALLLTGAWVSSYLALSRRGDAFAEKFDMEGFYYLPPVNTDRWRVRHRRLEIVFSPLNAVDRLIGTGRSPASEPLWDIAL